MELRTAECVTPGHPDKVADQISDAILDRILRNDPNGRCAVETLVTRNLVVVAGETSDLSFNYEGVVRSTLKSIGYCNDYDPEFDADTVEVVVAVRGQSGQIAQGLSVEQGAGDQGTVFGYATNEIPNSLTNYMPAPVFYARRVLNNMKALDTMGTFCLGLDGKSQVTIAHDDYSGQPEFLHTLLVSHQHLPGTRKQVEELVREAARNVFPRWMITKDTKFIVNPKVDFIRGGPACDTGVTGRKIIVDTYGGAVPHGGGAFSGKDPTKIDRSGAYMARCLAKNIVRNGWADRCLVEISYGFGIAKPLAVRVDTFNPDNRWEEKGYADLIERKVDLTPEGIITTLDLRKPRYYDTARLGHFADIELPWEDTKLF